MQRGGGDDATGAVNEGMAPHLSMHSCSSMPCQPQSLAGVSVVMGTNDPSK